MALYAFDGTWNRNDAPEGKRTNVWRFFKAHGGMKPGSRDFYRKGVGTRFGTVGRVVGGTFGSGAKKRLREAYRALYENYAVHGDKVIDIVGFSRGAAMAVHFANIVADHGIRKPKRALRRDPVLGWGMGFDHSVPREPATIRFLGVWDIVASFGLVIGALQRTNPGFKVNLPEGNVVEHGAHAMALDERRYAFTNERLTVLRDCRVDERGEDFPEVWFHGVHSDVGGSGGLGDITFCWMVERALAAGVTLDFATLDRTPTYNPNAAIGTNLNPRIEKDRKICQSDWVHEAAKEWSGTVFKLTRFVSWKRLFTFTWKSPPEARPISWGEVQIDTSPANCKEAESSPSASRLQDEIS